MKTRIILTFILLYFNITNGQDAIFLKPDINQLLRFSTDEENQIKRRDNLLNKKEPLSQSEQKELDSLLDKYSEVIESIWDAVHGGCSWYCGAGNFKITASSYLQSGVSTDYTPENIHDLNYKTAWAEGVKGHGIGEYIEYSFDKNHPRITEILIANGYVKSEKAWFENSRVKTLKMYVNGEPFATLALNDTKALQSFKLKVPLGRNNGNDNWVLKFEILDIYKGDKFDDVVISELFFDGVDVH